MELNWKGLRLNHPFWRSSEQEVPLELESEGLSQEVVWPEDSSETLLLRRRLLWAAETRYSERQRLCRLASGEPGERDVVSAPSPRV